MSKVVFDIGGTSMRVAIVDGDAIGNILKVATPEDPNEGAILLLDLIHKVTGDQGVESIVGGLPGIVTEGKIFKLPNLPKWSGYDVKEFLQKEVCKEVQIYNDAVLAALGEAVNGAGKDFNIVGYIGVGTGVGGARIVNKKIDSDTHSFEPGQTIADIENKVTFEEKISGKALSKKYGLPAEKIEQSIYDELTPTLAIGLYDVILFWSPEVLVLGGSLVNGEVGFQVDKITVEINKLNKVLPNIPEIRKAKLGDSAGLYGAKTLL